jgi:hypothetical protein
MPPQLASQLAVAPPKPTDAQHESPDGQLSELVQLSETPAH